MSKSSNSRRSGTGRTPQSGPGSKQKTRPLDSYLSGAILVTACFVLFLPLVVNYDFYYPYVFLKSILFRVAVEVMTLLYVVLAVQYPSYRPRIGWLSGAFVAYFGAMLVASLPDISLCAWNSWWGEFARMGGMFTQLHLLAYFFILVHVVKSDRHWITLFTASLFFNTIMAMSGMIQTLGLRFVYKFNPDERLQGAAGNALWFGSMMVISFFLVIWFLCRRDKRETYAHAAKYWFVFLAALDLLLIALQLSGTGLSVRPAASDSATLPLIAAAIALHLVSIAWFFVRRAVAFGVVVFLLVGCVNLYWLYQSQSRSAAVGLVAALALATAFYVVTGIGRKTRFAGIAVLALVVLIPAAVWMNRRGSWVQSHPALVRLTNISAQDFIADRYWPWKASVLAMLNHPVLGWGLENYSCGFDLHFPPKVINTWESMPWFDRAHNIFLDVGTTTGLLGLSIYLVFYGLAFAFLIRRWFRTRDPASTLAVAGLLLAYLLMGLATFDIINTDVILYAVLAYVVWLCEREGTRHPAEAGRHEVRLPFSAAGRVWVGAASAVLATAFWFLVQEPCQSNLLLNRGVQAGKVVDARTGVAHLVYGPEVRNLYLSANSFQTMGRFEVREEFANYVSELVEMAEVPLEERYVASSQAVDLLQESIRQDPENARRYMYFASLIDRCMVVFQAVDQFKARPLVERSLEALQTAQRLSPARPQLYFELGRAYAWLGRFDDQAAAIEKGMALSPPLTGARYFGAVVKDPNLNLLAAYIGAGKPDAAAKQWDKMKSLSITLTRDEYESIIRLYASRKQFDPIIRLRQEQLQGSPNDPQLLAALATTYRETGQLDLARQTALKAAALSPGSGQAIQAFLESLKK